MILTGSRCCQLQHERKHQTRQQPLEIEGQVTPALDQLESQRQFKFAVNRSGRNKDWDYKKLAGNFRDVEGDIYRVIDEVQQGHALCAGLLNGKWRSKSNFAGSSWILIDIDNSAILKDADGQSGKDADSKTVRGYEHQLTLDEALAHPFIQKHCALIYTTASHRPVWHKFRLIFVLPEYVSDIDIYESMVRLLMEQLPHDPSCKDASRVFYGSTEAEFPLIQPQAVLPPNWMERAISLGEAEKQARQQRIIEQQKRQAEFESLAQSEGWNIDTLIRNALSYIPPRMPGSGNYDECRDVIAGLTSYYGTGAVAIAESWSPSILGTTWNVDKKVRSFLRGHESGITYRTIFWLAEKHGWQYPKSNKTFKKYDPIDDPSYQAYLRADRDQDRAEEAEERERNLNRFKGFCNKIRVDKRQKIRNRAPEIASSTAEKQRYVPGFLPKYQQGVKLPVFTLETMRDRNILVYEAAEKGWKHVLDQSGTGSGKSHYAGLLEPERFEFGGEASTWYLTNESRNPATKTIEANFKALPVRNHGMQATEKTTPTEYPVMKPVFDRSGRGNCQNAHLFLLASQKGFDADMEAKNNAICQKCPFNIPLPGEKGSQCANHEGEGYGFRYQRRQAMQESRLRLNSQSVPGNIPNHIAMVWEEISAQLKVITRKTTAQELNTEWWKIESEAPKIYTQLLSIRKLLSSEMSTPSEHWGTVARHFIEALDLRLSEGERATILEQLRPILCPSLSELIKTESSDNSGLRKERDAAQNRIESLFRKIEDRDRKIAVLTHELPTDIPRIDDPSFRLMRQTQGLQTKIREYWKLTERREQLQVEFVDATAAEAEFSERYERAKSNTRKLQGERRDEALNCLEKAPTQALWHILNILFFPQQGVGNFRIHEGEITVTLPDERVSQLIKAASLNLFLDATVKEQVIKASLGIEDILICELEQEESHNLKHYQVIGFGRCTKNRAESTNERLAMLHEGVKAREATHNIQIADYKSVDRFEAKIRHLSNSRGSNEIEGSPVLIVHGLPKPNQGAIEDEYACLPNPDFTFEQYYQYRVDAEIKQLAGRQRSERPKYRHKQFSIYWVNEDSMPFEAEQIEAIDISYQAAPKSQRIAKSVFEAIVEVARNGKKLTQALIAQLAGVTQGFVSKWFDARGGWKYWRDLLLGEPVEDIEKYRSQLEPAEAVIAEVLPIAIDEATNPEQVLEAVSEFFEDLGTNGFRRIWKAIVWKYRRRFIAALLTIGLPQEVWREPSVT
ncbi:MAG: PriCT-2 domain-containing protein [Leptolyngbya sp. UWPOB_LEPTO1]|uniref:PriCT-2 domain-containing protein n=1 Tax=Leptolyngbya sp. UWPOB_LEPTO1 TaxID=2815653 RepID=UPI001AC0DA30|nr:PriCT-2 domain-containing protein [Leptolyngbya sp. UWPOB_LEPTO1]MBN8564116.1 PriCT-2 domain-containing protein [Leptolyngbya sp. UWPOB_LEPTO1]